MVQGTLLERLPVQQHQEETQTQREWRQLQRWRRWYDYTRSQPPGCRVLLDRLHVGQEWLVNRWLELQELDLVEDTRAVFEARVWEACNLWSEIEWTVRWVYGYEGCVVSAEGCDARAPERCAWCRGQMHVFVCER